MTPSETPRTWAMGLLDCPFPAAGKKRPEVLGVAGAEDSAPATPNGVNFFLARVRKVRVT